MTKKTKEKVVKKKSNSRKNFWGHFFVKLKTVLSELLFPENLKCIFCDVDIPDFEHVPYCEECAKSLPFNNGHICEICGQPIFSDAKICDFCLSEKKYFEKAFCPFLYDGKVKRALLGYKESNQRYRAKTFAKLIVQYMGDVKVDIITYIPMTPKKEKERTFNQSQLLAEEIGKILNLPVLCLFSKVKDGKMQKRSTFKERRANMIGTYVCKKANLKKSQNVLIVDDIITTCATVNYCAGLIYPKVNKIYVCALAREYIRPEKQKEIKFKKENILSFEDK